MKPLAAALFLLAFAAALPSPRQMAARRFLSNFANNRLDAASSDFNEQMRATVTRDVLANFKQQFDRDLGHFRTVSAVREGIDAGFPLVELTAEFEKGPALVQVTFDADGRIGALHFGRVPTSNPELERTARQVLELFNNRRFEEIPRYLDPKMSAQLPPSSLESLYDGVTGVYGKFQAVTDVKYVTQQDLRIINLFAKYEKQPMLFEVVFNAAGKIAGWSFRPPK